MPKPRFSGGSVSMRVWSSQMLPPERLQQAGDAVERGRLAATRRPQERDELAALDGQGQLVQRVERLAAGAGEAARDVIEPQLGEIVFHQLSNPSGRRIRA